MKSAPPAVIARRCCAKIVDSAVVTVPGAAHAGITLLERSGRISSSSPTPELVARLDQAQAAMREGPAWPPPWPRSRSRSRSRTTTCPLPARPFQPSATPVAMVPPRFPGPVRGGPRNVRGPGDGPRGRHGPSPIPRAGWGAGRGSRAERCASGIEHALDVALGRRWPSAALNLYATTPVYSTSPGAPPRPCSPTKPRSRCTAPSLPPTSIAPWTAATWSGRPRAADDAPARRAKAACRHSPRRGSRGLGGDVYVASAKR